MKKIKPLTEYNRFIQFLEKKKLIERSTGFHHNYQIKYPFFNELEENHEVVKRECERLLELKDQIHNVQGMGGKKTEGGIHDIQWKSFMFKAGSFIDENCELCPETAKMLKRIPRIKQAFFSILYPNQYIYPHRGYFRGFLRYHLGVIVPSNNADKKCWLRVDDQAMGKSKDYDKDDMKDAEIYHWKNGEGVLFDDNYLHDAANESNEIRVVLWIDVVRKFPFWFDWLNKSLLFIAYRTKKVKEIAKNAVVKIPKEMLEAY